MLIYCSHTTNRLQYIVNELFDASVQVTTNLQQALQSNEAVLNYSIENIANSFLQIAPVHLLFEEDIKPQPITISYWQNEPIFFETQGTIAFDFLAATFYLLTRYEEYLSFAKDEHQRFTHVNSLAYQHQFLHKPLINVWIDLLQKQFPALAFKQHQFSFTPTYDVDIAYQYKHHGFVKNVLQLGKLILSSDFKEAINLLKTITQKKEDDFDIFNEIEKLHNELNLKPIYFLMYLQQQAAFDKNLLFNNVALLSLYAKLKSYTQLGLHQSFRAGQQQMQGNGELFAQELNTAQKQFSITKSRQHYLMLKFPNTYQTLLQQGITADYSLGYSGVNGFRASYCHCFYWFDLSKNKTTALLLYPFVVMDNVPINKLNQTPHQSLQEFEDYVKTVKKYNGIFIAVFHNHFINKGIQGKPWLNWHNNFLKLVCNYLPTK